MLNTVRGSPDGRLLRVAVIQARFNESVTQGLLDGALRGLEEAGVPSGSIQSFSVPGAVEIPVLAGHLARTTATDAIIALGAVIRGETSHYDYVCQMVADGCLRVSLDTGIPVAFGVLTCDTAEQAFARCQDNSNNKGREAALVAIELANLIQGRTA